MPSLVPTIAVLLTLVPTLAAGAQEGAFGALEGTVHERSSVRSPRLATVSVRRIEPDTGFVTTTRPDAQGRYRTDSLPAGRYRVRIASAALDSLGIAPPSTELRIQGGRVVLADFTLPASAALRDAVCGARLGVGRGAIAGHALDADADGAPLAGGEVVATWLDFSVDQEMRRSMPKRRVMSARTGATGEYHLCGVPTEQWFTVQLRNRGRAGATLTVLITDDEAVMARDFSLSMRSAPSVAELDQLERAAERRGRTVAREELQTVGGAELAGVVRGLSGEPFVGAKVHVRDARTTAVTDSAGRFALTDLPAGTQVLVVRHPGYADAELPVELRAGKRVEQIVLLVRPLTNEAVQTTASLADYEVFDANRRMNTYGQFLTLDEIDKKKHATETVDLFDEILGFSAFGHGANARLVSNTALANGAECTSASVVIQGAEGRKINDVTPRQIAGIEAYSDAAFVPKRFAGTADCGLIVIWLRKPTRQRPNASLRFDGMP